MNENIVFLGVTENYPLKYSANNSKNELLARALIEVGCGISVVNGINGFPLEKTKYRCGELNNIKYYVFRKGNIFQLIKNLIYTFTILKNAKRAKEDNYLLIGYSYFPIYISYILIARLLRYKAIVVITEWHLFFEKKSLFKRLNYFLFDYLFGYFIQGVLPISEIIAHKIKHFKKPVLKIPILADFNSIKPINYLKDNVGVGYFLYCGDIAYWDIIEFTIDSFKLFSSEGFRQRLHLVINGHSSDINKVHGLIKSRGIADLVIVSTKLPFDKLIKAYQGALALLIPLRTEKQDTARFPHKIGEYIASGRPIITGNVGEVGRFFSNNNAYVADAFLPEKYADLMVQVASNIEQANTIGASGRKTGEDNFHYSNYGDRVLNFLKKL